VCVLLLLQAVTLLECFIACGVSPQPQTVDHLVLQLVQGGLQHAPVAGIAQLLSVLAATQHNPGPLFVKNYASVSSLRPSRLPLLMCGVASCWCNQRSRCSTPRPGIVSYSCCTSTSPHA
jgi:hypothetical protein